MDKKISSSNKWTETLKKHSETHSCYSISFLLNTVYRAKSIYYDRSFFAETAFTAVTYHTK